MHILYLQIKFTPNKRLVHGQQINQKIEQIRETQGGPAADEYELKLTKDEKSMFTSYARVRAFLRFKLKNPAAELNPDNYQEAYLSSASQGLTYLFADCCDPVRSLLW